MSKEEKDKIKEYQRKRCLQLIHYKKEALQNKLVLFLLSIRMSEKTLKFNNIRLNKKEFHKSKFRISKRRSNSNEYRKSLSIVMMLLNILLVTKKVKLLNCYVLSYPK